MTADSARVCVFSPRNLEHLVSRCADYRFEDIIVEVENAQLVAPRPRRSFPVRRRASNRLAARFSRTVDPGVERIGLRQHFDLFFVKCLFPHDLLALHAVPGWRDRCDVAVCWLSELFVHQLDRLEGHLRILQDFDHVLLNMSDSAAPLEAAIGVPCSYTIPGVDAITFSPYPHRPPRSIDVYSLGRRSAVTHRALLRAADGGQIFYIYDTIDRMLTSNPHEHRNLTANLAKRSRYFIANPVKVNVPHETAGQRELGYRFFEGAAAGTIMIGEAPGTDTFTRYFDWPDAHFHVPYDAENILDILADLDAQPERIAKARRAAVSNSLRRFDWAHSWRAILGLAGLEPSQRLIAREEQLELLALMADHDD